MEAGLLIAILKFAQQNCSISIFLKVCEINAMAIAARG